MINKIYAAITLLGIVAAFYIVLPDKFLVTRIDHIMFMIILLTIGIHIGYWIS